MMAITLTYLGHSGFLVESGSHRIAIDPFLTGNPLATMRPEEIVCQSIVLTHGHSDHFGDTLAIARANDATVYAAFEICEYCGGQGVASTEPMNPGGPETGGFYRPADGTLSAKQTAGVAVPSRSAEDALLSEPDGQDAEPSRRGASGSVRATQR